MIARAGDPAPLLSVWTCAPAADAEGCALEHEALVMRDGSGERTEAGSAMPRFFGLA